MLRKEKAGVKDFYDNFGWITDTDGNYRDTKSFADIRPVLSSYSHDTQMRVRRFLKPSGQYFLDAGSGPLSEPEYMLYSAGYAYRVCLDLSERALKEARDKVGSHGLYVMADVTNLPFREGTFDAILVSHVLYHIPDDEQANTVLELYSTLKDGGTCLIIYYWQSSFISKIGELLSKFFASIALSCAFTRIPKSEAPDTFSKQISSLYFRPLDYGWLKRNLPKHWKTEIRSWRSVDIFFTRGLVADNLVGMVLLRIFYWLEDIFPHALGRLGRYPMIIIQKTAG